MTGKRWQGYLPTQVDVECSGDTHWVRWEAGEIIPLNHADASGERTLSALARKPVPCLELTQLWARHTDDLRILALASRGSGDPLNPPERASGQPNTLVAQRAPRSQWYQVGNALTRTSRSVLRAVPGTVGAAAPPPMPAIGGPVSGGTGDPMKEPLVRLLTMAGPLADRLVATVAATWNQQLAEDAEGIASYLPRLEAALYGRVLASVRAWLGVPGLQADVQMATGERTPEARRDDDGVHIVLPFSWIAEVWARGLAVVLGRFVLGVEEASEDRTVLMAVGPDFGGVSRLTIAVDPSPAWVTSAG